MARLKKPWSEAPGAEPSQERAMRAKSGDGVRDPRWVLSPAAGRIAAHMFYLMTGAHAECRVHGWVAMARASQGDGPTAADVWAQHGPALMADAQAYDFQPWMVTRKQPTGAGFARWRDDFLKAHSY
jgi:hypothetical protein